MPRRNSAKAIAVLDAMLEFFDGGRRWTRGVLRDAAAERRCLIGTLRHVRRQQRIRGAGTDFYLHAALSIPNKPPDTLMELVMAQLCRSREPNDRDLMGYNDGSSYDEVRALIVEARALAQAELDEARDQRRADALAHIEGGCISALAHQRAIA